MPKPARAVVATCVLSVLLAASAARADGGAPNEASAARGPLGPMTIGVLAGASVPDGLRLDLAARYAKYVSFGGAVSALPEVTVPGEDAHVERLSGEGWVRVHPLGGRLFVGVAGGYARTKGSAPETSHTPGQDETAQANAFARDLYVTPQTGLMLAIWKMTAVLDLGAELPVVSPGPSFTVTRGATTSGAEGKGAMAQAMRFAARSPLPFVSIELGFML